MKQKERIEKMEKILFNSSKLLEELEEILNKLDEDSKNYNELVKYYYSKNWAKDKEDFPSNLMVMMYVKMQMRLYLKLVIILRWICVILRLLSSVQMVLALQ